MLDGRTKETAIQSVAALLHCSEDELGHYFLPSLSTTHHYLQKKRYFDIYRRILIFQKRPLLATFMDVERLGREAIKYEASGPSLRYTQSFVRL